MHLATVQKKVTFSFKFSTHVVKESSGCSFCFDAIMFNRIDPTIRPADPTSTSIQKKEIAFLQPRVDLSALRGGVGGQIFRQAVPKWSEDIFLGIEIGFWLTNSDVDAFQNPVGECVDFKHYLFRLERDRIPLVEPCSV